MSRSISNKSALGTIAKYQYMQRFAVDYAFNAKTLSQQWDNINPELESINQKHRELLAKKYRSKRILITAVLLSLIWFIIFILYVIIFLTI
jgi:hypothetical protein